MSREPKSYSRAKAKFRENPRILVLCEDSKSSLTYLREAARHFRAYADVVIAHTGRTDPLGIVEEAAKRKKEYSAVYCAIDRDTHLNFEEAVRAAQAEKVNLIVSYPCYEYWLILHFKRTRKTHVSVGGKSAGARIVEDLCNCDGMGNYKKGSTDNLFADLLEKLPVASCTCKCSLGYGSGGKRRHLRPEYQIA